MERTAVDLEIEVFDFDGPFGPAKSLGHVNLNFLKHTPDELADMWVYLDGNLARSSLSKLHLKIFLDNNNGAKTIREYLAKMENEVGKKLNLRSPHRNSTFQKIFGLPEDEFLIGDFTCSLRRKIPLQGRIFLSPRVMGFYSNLFGHKIRFFFLWEDIDDVLVLPPSFSSVGSPSLVIILRKDLGLDAQHGAKCRDEEGRLRFYFQSFLSFHDASRTIMALWRTRNPDASCKPHTVEEQSGDEKLAAIEDNVVTITGVEDVELSKMYSAELPVEMNSFMELFSGGDFEHRIMERSGCLDYCTTEWVAVSPGAWERSVSYKLDRRISNFGGKVTGTQQKVLNEGGWIVNEVVALQNIPFADYFKVHVRYQIGGSAKTRSDYSCEVHMGILWLKSTKFQQRIGQNVTEKLTRRLRHVLEQFEPDVG
ncbi:hypothetical protein MLD38_039425 [Melastoma candidum]|uniref:Uncharacterized protein n=1 Tax=Melastoma candidum TaxID=119954 RepID=A0ACB9L2C6_9MYRT|nr:hypothetical protein MLD38_039425 [Melastoma candidum]